MLRISQNGQKPIIDVDTLEDIEPAIRELKAGIYEVDEIGTDPLASGHNSKQWGVVIKWRDGAVFLEPDPWDALGIAVNVRRMNDGDQQHGPR